MKKNFVDWKKEKSWRKRKLELKAVKEKRLLEYAKKIQSDASSNVEDCSSQKVVGNQGRPYSLSIAIPGSILNNAQSPELRMYLAGQVARAASISCVDEIVVFDEYARVTPNQLDSYYDGKWQADKPIRDDNSECNFHMARVLEYLECPQYLRRALFPLQKSLAYAGVLNPLECPHHLRAANLSFPYREAVILDKPVKKGRGPLCDVGLDKELQLESEIDLPPLTRVTVQLINTDHNGKRYQGKLISPQHIRHEAGVYWGYSIRVAQSLSDALNGRPPYDYVIGTSESGKPIEELNLHVNERCRILIVFGGLKGLEAAIEADETLSTSDPTKVFQHYVSIAADQGSRTIRTEEAVLMTLSVLKSRLDFPYNT